MSTIRGDETLLHKKLERTEGEDMKKQTQKEKFFAGLEDREFNTRDNFTAKRGLEAHHYIDHDGNHHLITGICITDFAGTYTRSEDLGCICSHIISRTRAKGHRRVERRELMKRVSCPESAEKALRELDAWIKESFEVIAEWKVVI